MHPLELMAETPLLLLAGGRSARMGQPKGLLTIAGMPLFHWQLRRFHAAGGQQAMVILGYAAEAYRDAGVPPELTVVMSRNPNPEHGPFSSVQHAWRQSEQHFGKSRGAFILPVDVLAADAATWHQLAEAGGPVSVPTYAGRGGHPVYLDRDILAMACSCPPTDRLDWLLRRIAKTSRLPTADASVVTNINTAADWTTTKIPL